MGSASDVVITLLHFNDVYNIEPQDQEPVGGAARFKTAVKQREHLHPLVVFSGDAFNPSLMSAITKGKQMVPIMNAIGVHVAVYGNHDFDHGVDTLVEHAQNTKFPWLMSNVYDETTEEPLADGLVFQIIEWQGKKLAFIGLVEEEWIDTLSTLDPEDILFYDYVERGRELAKQLKEENGADFVIALTHMRWPNDTRLAENVEEIDLILGGHDHDFGCKVINGKHILKSGTDFRQLGQVTVTFTGDKTTVSVEEVSIDSSIEEDPDVKVIVQEYLDIMGEKMDEVIGQMEVELDGRFNRIRTCETNLGNFVCDIMLKATNAEVAILNSGTLRSDRVHPKGEFKVKDLLTILPLVDAVVVLKCTGEQLHAALENGVSMYPKLEGRFPQVAGVSFTFEPHKPSGDRVDINLIKVQGVPLQRDKEYRVCTKHYIAGGKDGYDVFKECEVLVGEEEGPRLSTIIQNHFKAVDMVRSKRQGRFKHRQSLVPIHLPYNFEDDFISALCRRSLSMQHGHSHDTTDSAAPIEQPVHIEPVHSQSVHAEPGRSASVQSKPSRDHAANRRAKLARRESIHEVEQDGIVSALSPMVDNRILILDSEERKLVMEQSMLGAFAAQTISE